MSRRLFVLLAPVAFAACTDDPPPDLSAKLGPRDARAGVVAKASDLVPGPTAQGGIGDFKLYNSRVAVIIEAPGPSDGYGVYGGSIVDAAPIRDGVTGLTHYGEALALYNKRTPRGVTAQVLADGTGGGAATIRVTAVDDGFALIESILGQSAGPMSLEMQIDYTLLPDSPFVRIETSFHNAGDKTLYIGDHFVGYVMGDGLRQFLPGHGFDIPTVPRPSPYFAAASRDVTYTFLSADGQFAPTLTFEGFLLGTLPIFNLVAGARATNQMDLVIGDADLAAHLPIHEQLRREVGHDPVELFAVSGTVTAGGAPVVGTFVHVMTEAEQFNYVTRTITRENGTFSLQLPAGRYELRAGDENRDAGAGVLVTVGSETPAVTLTSGETGKISIAATEGAGSAVPVKVFAKRVTGGVVPPASFGVGGRPHGHERIEFTNAGPYAIDVPVGEYDLVATRGFEYERETTRLTVAANGTATWAPRMRRVVDTTGWLSADYHVHAQFSADSDDLVDHKVLAAAGEGLEIPVSTEHDHIGDFLPVIARLGVGAFVTSISGSEVSTTQLGHFNAFPLVRDPTLPNFGAVSWYGRKGDDVMKAMRANAGNPIVQVNHPRSGSFGSPFIKGYFSAVGFDPATFVPRDPHDWTVDFDAVEVANDGGPDYTDWFSFLDRGYRILGTGDSDSHTARTDAVGYPRNFVPVGHDDPSKLDLAQYMSTLRAGRLSVSGGFFVELGAGSARLGDLLPPSAIVGGKVTVQAKVQAASWVGGGTLELVVNGNVAKSLAISAGPDVVRATETIELEVPANTDSWVIARVRGASNLPLPYPGKESWGFTNPIFVDANGNGSFDARLPRP